MLIKKRIERLEKNIVIPCPNGKSAMIFVMPGETKDEVIQRYHEKHGSDVQDFTIFEFVEPDRRCNPYDKK